MNYSVVKTDVLIIGGGVSGYMAAYNIAKDKQVTLLSTGRGASPYITGFNYIFAEGDSIDCYIEDSFISGKNQNYPELIEALCRGSAETYPFLHGLGMEFDMDGNSFRAKRPVGSRYPRVIGKDNITGAIIYDILREKLEAQGNFKAEDSVRALRLLVKDGRACGAFCYDIAKKEGVCFDAKAVVLAIGGFCKIFGFNTNTSDMGADGIAMAYEAGLPLVDMEFVQFEPSGTIWPDAVAGHGMVTTVLYEGATVYNKNHERFMFKYSDKGEQVNKDELARGFYSEVLAGNGGPHGGVFFDCTGVPAERLHSSAYESYYKRYLGAGLDITKDPIEVFPAAHTSLGGVKINADCSTAIEGLFACGEIAGGVHGANRIGGSAGTETIVFGKIAGVSADKYLDGCAKNDTKYSSEINSQSNNDCDKIDTNYADWDMLIMQFESQAADAALTEAQMLSIRSEIGNILSGKFNAVRNGKDMEEGSARISELLDAVRKSGVQTDAELFYKRARLQNDLEAAWLFTKSAIERKESVGAHWRTDAAPAADKPYSIQLTKGADGKLSIAKNPVK